MNANGAISFVFIEVNEGGACVRNQHSINYLGS
jgi:hypothetical protein